MSIIVVGIHKGGTAKTTTVINLAAGLADQGFKVCAVDTDPQAQLALGLGCRVREDRTLVQVLFDELPAQEATVNVRGFDLLPCHDDLNGADIELSKQMDGWGALRRALSPLASSYDYIVIDTPPQLGMLTANALAAGQWVLIPVETQQAAYDQLPPFVRFVEKAQKRLNADLSVLGLLPTKFARRQRLDEQILAYLQENRWSFPVFAPIRRSTKIAESFSLGVPVMDHTRAVSDGYERLVEDVIAKTKGES